MQPEGLLHAIKVPIRMQEFVVIQDAECTDDDIDSLANSDAEATYSMFSMKTRNLRRNLRCWPVSNYLYLGFFRHF